MSRFAPFTGAGTDRFGGGGIPNPNRPSLPLGIFARERVAGAAPKVRERLRP